MAERLRIVGQCEMHACRRLFTAHIGSSDPRIHHDGIIVGRFGQRVGQFEVVDAHLIPHQRDDALAVGTVEGGQGGGQRHGGLFHLFATPGLRQIAEGQHHHSVQHARHRCACRVASHLHVGIHLVGGLLGCSGHASHDLLKGSGTDVQLVVLVSSEKCKFHSFFSPFY